MGQSGTGSNLGHQGVSNGELCKRSKTTIGYFFCLVTMSVSVTFFFHAAHNLGFLEGIAKRRADFTAGIWSQLNLVSDEQIYGHIQHGRQQLSTLKSTSSSAGSISSVAPSAEVLTGWKKGTLQTDGSDSAKLTNTSERAALYAEPANFESIISLNSQNNTSLSSEGECDLYTGKWVPGPMGSLYKNHTCPLLSQSQNCLGNGRPDTGYENWRWKPSGCSLPRFHAEAFLGAVRGKVIAFVGDSIARNHMESLMCCLMQVEAPNNRGCRKMQRWYFPRHSVTIIRIWSAWLVSTSRKLSELTPVNVTNLHLDQADEAFMEFLPKFDVLIISSGHWYTKKTAYMMADKLVGGQGWRTNTPSFRYNSSAAFALAMQTALNAIVSHPEYHGLTIFRTYSPKHYEGGQWNVGGSCTGNTRPFTNFELPYNAYTELMHQHQLNAFRKAELNVTNKSKLRLMDVTPVFRYRADGHPGIYTNQDPIKQTKRGKNGFPSQDCLHWCMPGPIDTWNEFLFETLKQELLG
ncbi:hypothetical protein O6H91_17G001800 [Diphasiastrum complanatum]|uniref:Uncharacterized protein n=2 Tax=Diphasiastrum complanatum TaxID=34168 RepID=A0ACC2B3K2_DIPCM|nr:hypothetical protein O6H91_17G000600 [Diphasiastrum complanatum]KAJ7524369.1 hypothetical protein O6H91_17G001800 [Diphasiastrum complanatum]